VVVVVVLVLVLVLVVVVFTAEKECNMPKCFLDNCREFAI